MLDNLANKKLILGSGSPRRAKLLEEMQLNFEVIVKPINETYPEALKPFEVAEYLAKKKSEAFLAELGSNEIVITADTIVCIENQILNKPQDLVEAKSMLLQLSKSVHEVITGVSILSSKKKVVFHATSEVTFSELTNVEIDFYLNHFDTLDKAGAYGIQDWIGLIGVESIKGSFYNVVGLPTNAIFHHLKEF